MLTRIITLFFILVFANSCQQNNQTETDCQQLFAQEGIEDLYEEAIWQVYKFNLIDGDRFEVKNPSNADVIYTENSLSEFDLELIRIHKFSDTVVFTFLFERDVSPADYPYYSTVAFWSDKEMIEIGDRIIFTMEKNAYESKFKEYLWKNKKKLSHKLKCLAVERYGWEDNTQNKCNGKDDYFNNAVLFI